MEEALSIMFYLLCIVLGIMIFRWIGAWMLRINEIIDNQNRIIDSLNTFNNNFLEIFDKSEEKEEETKKEI